MPLRESSSKKIIEIRENIATGTVEILYAKKDLEKTFEIGDINELARHEFLIGRTRAGELKDSLLLTPHLLIAGETDSGKSTFLRQFIAAHYLNDKTSQFLLIDLKEGVEFQLFEKLPRAAVFSDITSTVTALKKIKPLLKHRLSLLKANGCTNLNQFLKTPYPKRKYTDKITKEMPVGRFLIVVDEASDLFLTGSHAASEHVHVAKDVLGQVARKGRAVGIHLVVATQKPDKRALDTQIKSNLIGSMLPDGG